MHSTLRSMGAAVVLAVAVLGFTVAVVSPYLPQEIARPAYRTKQRLGFDAAQQVRIEAPEAAVRVLVAQQAGVQVVANIRAYASTTAGAAVAKTCADAALAAEETEEELVVRIGAATPPAGVSLRSEVTVYVPKAADVAVAAGNGSVRVEAGCGAVTVSGTNADITVYGPLGPVDATTDNGRISVYDAPDSARLKTKNGSIYAHMLGGELEAVTVNGYIGATLLAPAVRRCDLTSTNGGITLALAPDCAALLDAETGRGTVKSDVPAEPALPVAGVRDWRGLARGGDAGEGAETGHPCQVTMRTRNGNLSIRKSGL